MLIVLGHSMKSEVTSRHRLSLQSSLFFYRTFKLLKKKNVKKTVNIGAPHEAPPLIKKKNALEFSSFIF